MSPSLDPSDEYILAAFLSGELPVELRREIAAYLSRSDEARDVLTMAQEAMDVVESGDGAPVALPQHRTSRRRFTEEIQESLRNPDTQRSVWKVTAVFAGAVLVLTLIVMTLVLARPWAVVVPPSESWAPMVESSGMTISWHPVEKAEVYHVLHHDPGTRDAQFLASVTSPELTLDDSGLSGHIWIAAYDNTGQLISQSVALSVVSQ